MCGIAGVAGRAGALGRERLPAILEDMAASMAHRGPDDQGVEIAENGSMLVGLCARRLAIQDCSELGHQPMRSEATGHVVAFNGEIYNVGEVRSALEAAGHRFRGHSDTEVVLRGYDEWGVACLERLRGMFAVAIWDARRGRLVVARDRLGIKPLYYHADGDRLVFASELRTLMRSGLVERELSHAGLASYLALGAVEEPLSMVEGVHVLAPGHYLELGPEGVELTEYWSLAEAFAGGRGDGAAPSPAETRELLEEVTRLHLVSDVPLGVFLSGGIDSSAMVALVATASGTPPRTVSVVFPQKELSEEPYIDLVSRRYETDHTAVHLDEPAILRELPGCVEAMDQPTHDGVNTYVVSRAAREAGLTVVLSGLGGDELFAGYDTFRLVPRLQRARRAVPRPARPLASRAVATLGRGRDRAEKLARWLREEDAGMSAYALKREMFGPGVRRDLLARGNGADWTWHVDSPPLDAVNALSYLELSVFMRNVLLRDSDVMSMAHSLELRVPLLDHVLVEHVAATRGQHKLDGIPKPLFVEALGELLPHDIVHRPKMGFTLPFAHWMRGALRPQVAALLEDDMAGGQVGAALDGDAVREIWRRFEDGRAHWSRPWALYVAKAWGERHLPH